MNTYISITITRYGKDCQYLDYGSMTISVGELKVRNNRLSVQEAMKEMAKLAKLLNKTPELEVNRYNKSISYLHLFGYID